MDVGKYTKVCADVAEHLDNVSREYVIDMLQSLLQSEFLQRDLYEAYDYLLLGPEAIAVQSHLREHLEQEMEHIRLIQRYLVHFQTRPSLERHTIPLLQDPSLRTVLAQDLEQERKAVADYSAFIRTLEPHEEYTALRVDLENILVQESEHMHDIERWLEDFR